MDFVIIGMIVLSTVAVFLETFPISDGFRRALKVFDWIVQIFFTIEVSLRIWAADEIDPKYKGLWGRVRYCFSFYGLIDFLATYPVWLGFAFPAMMSRGVIQGFRVLRVARLFRVFRYMNASRFLGQAFRSKKKEMLVSLEFLAVITIVLSFILYLVEHDSNPVMLKGRLALDCLVIRQVHRGPGQDCRYSPIDHGRSDNRLPGWNSGHRHFCRAHRPS